MRVAVIGAGAVGTALATALAAGGQEVVVGRRDSSGEAIGDAEAVVVAIPGAAVPAFAAEHGAALAGRVVVDATNDMSGGPAGRLNHMDDWARHAPGARVVRAFNSVGWENVADPVIGGERADLLYCGPEDARAAAEELIRATGLRPVRIGGPEAADVLDGVARLWFALAFGQGRGRRVGFRVLEDGA